jgi:uncharacterized SAM-binding protein YcdF (DUF218 family)
MIYLHKILPMLLSPLGVALGFLLAFLWTKKRVYGWVALGLLVLPATPLVSERLIQWVEGPYTWQAAESAPEVDAIVVLSGSMDAKVHQGQLHWDMQDGDRLLAGIELIKAQRAKRLVFTGGRLPWNPQGETEGLALKRLAVAWGIPEQQIEVSSDAFNTADEAQAVAKLLANTSKRIVLVTSAFHMPRAQQLFQEQGLLVTPWPVDYKQSSDSLTVMHFLPQASALAFSTLMLREAMGRVYYGLKLW